jgi:hypothetical protein
VPIEIEPVEKSTGRIHVDCLIDHRQKGAP